jgi:hypothetical protein
MSDELVSIDAVNVPAVVSVGFVHVKLAAQEDGAALMQ